MVYQLYYEVRKGKLFLYERDMNDNLRFLFSSILEQSIEGTIRSILDRIPNRGGRVREFDFSARIITDKSEEAVHGHYFHPGYREARGI